MTPDAWQVLGRLTSHCGTAADALRAARLDKWNLRLEPVTARVGKRTVTVPDRCVVVRDSARGEFDGLSVVSTSYPLVQNEAYAPLLDEIAEECGATHVAAGALEGDRQVFVTMRLPGYAKIGGDEVVTYLSSLHSHDGSVARKVLVTPVHVRTGTLLAVHELRGTSGAQLVDEAFTWLERFQDDAEALAAAPLTMRQFEKTVWAALGAPAGAATNTTTRHANRVRQMLDLYDGGTTAWHGLVALASWWDHQSPTRGEDRDTARARNAIMSPKFKTNALRLMQAAHS